MLFLVSIQTFQCGNGGFQHIRQTVSIDIHCHADGGMPHPLADNFYIDSRRQKLAGISMTKGIEGNPLVVNVCRFQHPSVGAIQEITGQKRSADTVGKDQAVVVVIDAPIFLCIAFLPCLPIFQFAQCLLWQSDDPIAALGLGRKNFQPCLSAVGKGQVDEDFLLPEHDFVPSQGKNFSFPHPGGKCQQNDVVIAMP